jgi:DNA-binding response OmpR family regulator
MQAEFDHPTRSRLVVIDVDEAVRSALKRVLKGAGCEVCVAGDARSGADLLSAGSVDLAILDLDTFANDGAGLLEQFCRPEALCPVLILSRRADPSDREEAARVGGLLAKPVDPGVLLRTVAALLHPLQQEPHASNVHERRLALRRLQARGARFIDSNLPYRPLYH